jgi:penicillin-binding protein 1C
MDSKHLHERCMYSIGAFVATLLVVGAALAQPTYQDVRAGFRVSDSLLLDRHGAVLHELRTDPSLRRLGWVEVDAISPALQAAVVRAEDKRFWAHGGADFRALAAAAIRGIFSGRPRGASTITMQLAAMLDKRLQGPGGRRTISEKWRQIQAAWHIEQGWSKARILEAYLNLVSFRGEFQGVAAAARGLFGKEPHGIDGAESLLLAALIRSPNALAAEVAERAVHLRQALGWAAESKDIRALAGEALSHPRPIRPRVDLAPHAARRLLRGKVGQAVACSLDADIQRFALERLTHHLLPLKAQNVGEGAVLVVENATGDVLAYVSTTADPVRSRFVDGVTARRQAGSTLKPFLYALAFDRRILTPASLLDDSPLDVTVDSGIYHPGNYDGGFRGSVSARSALASSLNIPAVRTLEIVGGEAFLGALRELGFHGLREAGDFYGPALALGAADVTLWELVQAYRALANGGRAGELLLIRPAQAPELKPVFSPEAAFLVSDILADREARSLTFGLENVLATRFRAAVKTGTSKDMRDNWCIGYSPRFTVGVWVGNFTGEPMWDVSGVTGAAPVWLEVMELLHRQGPSLASAAPPGLVRGPAWESSGVREEWFIRGTELADAASLRPEDATRIVYPPDGAVFAVDSDIPGDRQRIFFAAAGGEERTRWVLNGRPLNAGRSRVRWVLVPGKHRLSLSASDGRTLDTVTFLVRGTTRPGA